MIPRRSLLTASAALAATALAAPLARAGDDEAASLYARIISINGNLIGPFDPDAPLDAPTAKLVKSSGLTAFKLTIGGANQGFAETSASISDIERALARSPRVYTRIIDVADLAKAKAAGTVGVIFSFEGIAMLEGKIARIDEFRKRGVRVMQLSYNAPSPFAAGCLASQPSSGLTPLGREAVARMNAMGVTLDLSHADAHSTLDALAATSKPALITHAGCDAIYAHPRNKTDAVLRALAKNGGVIGIYELSYLSAGPAQQNLGDYMAHLLHALSVCGEDHVGIGSDAQITPFDTSPSGMADWNKAIAEREAAGVAAPGEGRPSYVAGLNRPDRLEVIGAALLKHGYGTSTVTKILGANFERVFEQTWV